MYFLINHPVGLKAHRDRHCANNARQTQCREVIQEEIIWFSYQSVLLINPSSEEGGDKCNLWEWAALRLTHEYFRGRTSLTALICVVLDNTRKCGTLLHIVYST